MLWVGVSDHKAAAWPQLQGAAGLSGIGADQIGLWQGLWVLWVDGEGALPVLVALGDPLCLPSLLLAKRRHYYPRKSYSSLTSKSEK